jgi:hypothetical protein
MPNPQILFNIDSLDDPVVADGVPEFSGGQFSNWRANLLKPNQSKLLYNCDVDKLGKIRTRRGSIRLGPSAVGSGTVIQGLTSFQTKDTTTWSRRVAAKYTHLTPGCGGAGVWNQIATGGTVDNEIDLLAGRVDKQCSGLRCRRHRAYRGRNRGVVGPAKNFISANMEQPVGIYHCGSFRSRAYY